MSSFWIGKELGSESCPRHVHIHYALFILSSPERAFSHHINKQTPAFPHLANSKYFPHCVFLLQFCRTACQRRKFRKCQLKSTHKRPGTENRNHPHEHGTATQNQELRPLCLDMIVCCQKTFLKKKGKTELVKTVTARFKAEQSAL